MKRKDALIFVFYNLLTKKYLMEEKIEDKFFAGTRIFPDGKVEDYERKDFTKTLIRESLEEFGVKPLKFISFEKPIISETGYKLWIYLVTHWSGNILKYVKDKASRLIWLSEREFKSDLESTNKIFSLVRNFIMSHNIDNTL